MRRLLLLLLLATPAWGADSISIVQEGSNAFASIVFTDQNGASVSPTAATWKVTAAEDGTILAGPTTVASPGATWAFVIPHTVNTRTANARPGATITRKLNVAWTWSGGTYTATKAWTYTVNVQDYAPPTPTP